MLAELVDVGVEQLFCGVEALDVGEHGLVDTGVELAQQGHELVADAVAAGVELGIGVVLDILQASLGDVGVDVGAGEAEEGADDSE